MNEHKQKDKNSRRIVSTEVLKQHFVEELSSDRENKARFCRARIQIFLLFTHQLAPSYHVTP